MAAINFLGRFARMGRIIGAGTSSETAFGITSSNSTSSIASPGDGYTYYTWTSGGDCSFGEGTAGAPELPTVPITKSRTILGAQSVVAGDAYVECHGGGGVTGGLAYGTFSASVLTEDNPTGWYANCGGAGNPGGGDYAGFFSAGSAQHGQSKIIGGGGGKSAQSASGGTGGGTSGGNGSGHAGHGGPGPAGGGNGGSQTGGGTGGHGSPGRCGGQSGGALSGGNLGGGDPSGRPGGGGGAGYYGGGCGGCGYSGDNNCRGGGGGGGSGYVHPSATSSSNQTGSAQSGARVVVRVNAA